MFGLNDRLEVHLDHVRMPPGNGKIVEKTKWRLLNIFSVIKKSMVKAVLFCLPHVLVIALARLKGFRYLFDQWPV